MSQYLTSLVLVSALVGICSYISYGEKEEKAAKGAMALMLVCVTVAPLVSLVSSAVTDDWFYTYGENIPEISIDDTDFAENAEKAFSRGIKSFLKEEFFVAEGDCEVLLFRFDSVEMKAEKIKIILKGKAALADSRGIAEKINGMNIGKCEVEIYVKQQVG